MPKITAAQMTCPRHPLPKCHLVNEIVIGKALFELEVSFVNVERQ